MQMFNGAPGGQLDAYLERLRVQLPAAPEPLLDAYVKWAPWVAIVFGALSLVFFLGLGLLGVVLTPFLILLGAEGVGTGFAFFTSLFLGIVGSVAVLAGGSQMMKLRLTGWWLLAFGLVVSALSSVVSIWLSPLLILVLIAYIHLQVKPRYT